MFKLHLFVLSSTLNIHKKIFLQYLIIRFVLAPVQDGSPGGTRDVCEVIPPEVRHPLFRPTLPRAEGLRSQLR